MATVTGSLSLEGQLVDWVQTRPERASRLPVGWLSKEQKAAELQKLQQRKAIDTAREAQLVVGMAEDTPDRLDPPPGTPGAPTGGWGAPNELPGVSQFFTAELSMVLNCGRGTASRLAQRAWTYRENLPGTLAALAAGAIDERRARELADVLEHTNPDVARQVEQRLLPDATGLSLSKLRARATELMLELDAAAADARRDEALRSADVRAYPTRDGLGVLSAELPAEDVAACYDLIDQLAKMLKADGDPRRIRELRAAVLTMLIRRPADHGLPLGAVNLTVTAALAALEGASDAAGSVDGLPITVVQVRDLLRRIGALGLAAPEGGSLTFAITDPNGALLATVTAAELQRLGRTGCREHPDTGCGCPLLGPPPPTDAYPPTDRQRAFVTTRDRTCRFPNCGQRVGWADLDHVIPHACGGETTCTNLCCLCRSHHRLKTFAPGWRFEMDPDGTLHVTTPSGVTRTTRPPGVRAPEPEPPPVPEPPPAAPPPEDDPPPF